MLEDCAFVKDFFGFQQCIISLTGKFDLREFLGGMTAYHSCRRMAEVLGVQSRFQFADDFVDGKGGTTDPVMVAARIPRVQRPDPSVQLSSSNFAEADYCIALRWPDLLLWAAIMQRPRRDMGMFMDFVHTLAELSVQLLPRCVLYTQFPLTSLMTFN